jgi:hypothetical protein
LKTGYGRITNCFGDEVPIKRYFRNSPAINYWGTFATCFALLLWRGWVRVSFADLWAEDANVYFSETLKGSWWTIFDTYAGTFHVLQRLLALLVINLAPVSSWPAVTAVLCIAVTAACMAAIVRPGLEWIIPSVGARFFVAIMLCVMPGYEEMLGNLANLNWAFLLWMAFLGLRDPKKGLTWAELAVALLICNSLGTSVLLLPLFSWRLYTVFRDVELKQNLRKEAYLWLIFVVTLFTLIFLNGRGVNHDAVIVPDGLLGKGLFLLVEHAARLLILTPWLGIWRQNEFWVWIQGWIWPQILPWLVLSMITAFLVWCFKRNRPNSWTAILLFTIGIAGWPALNWIGRRGSLATFMECAIDPTIRYSFPMSAAGVIFWMALIRPTRLWGKGLSQAALFFIWAIWLPITPNDMKIRPRIYWPAASETYWHQSYPLLESSIKTGCPNDAFIPALPAGWGLTYHSPLGANCNTPLSVIP